MFFFLLKSKRVGEGEQRGRRGRSSPLVTEGVFAVIYMIVLKNASVKNTTVKKAIIKKRLS